MDYSQGNRQKKEKREDRIKEKFFMGGALLCSRKEIMFKLVRG